ncbi:hypothetical protein DPMN_071722 [Dreissena polymorpha]|uniref:Uncharacterized protein n=1 Tax=Dreissena polymorpha TaxID=45954 RepID=A0A9D3Z7I0_DREPO|nr:hypothetical protein DPMN_071722 [Dreissena polymorpha]
MPFGKQITSSPNIQMSFLYPGPFPACPPETVVSCLADIKDTITSSNHTRTDGIPLQYAVSCALLWSVANP